MFTVVLNSRNKDNKGIKDFRERKKVFLVREFEPYMGEREDVKLHLVLEQDLY